MSYHRSKMRCHARAPLHRRYHHLLHLLLRHRRLKHTCNEQITTLFTVYRMLMFLRIRCKNISCAPKADVACLRLFQSVSVSARRWRCIFRRASTAAYYCNIPESCISLRIFWTLLDRFGRAATFPNSPECLHLFSSGFLVDVDVWWISLHIQHSPLLALLSTDVCILIA
jgi:hypothetical protein